MRIIDCEQQSPEWYEARCGVPSASNFDKIVTIKGESSTQRTKYMYQLAGEYIIKTKEETYQNAAMTRGIELEPEAREFYEIISGNTVREVGFCIADGGYGASPDGLVGDKGGIEIKCPSLAVHVEYLLKNKLPSTYFQQVQGQMLVAELDWVDFISYYPAMKPLIVRVERDEEFISKLEQKLNTFCQELKETIKQIGD